jgi:hypothetical protein
MVTPNRGVYLKPFPATSEIHQIPKERLDFHPTWRSANEILYVSTAGVFSAISVQLEPTVMFGRPVRVPTQVRHDRVSSESRDYDVFPDGRLLLTIPGETQSQNAEFTSQMRVVLNWFDELKRLVPGN